MIARILTALLWAWALAGCQGTPYKPLAQGAGYAERPVGPRQWEIEYTATAVTPRRRLREYLLYHAAEVALGQGAERFLVLDEDLGLGPLEGIDPTGDLQRSPREIEHPYRWRPSGFDEPPGEGTTQYRPEKRHTARLRIRLLDPGETVPKPDRQNVYDARAVIRGLGPRILGGRRD
jgi:hypothetical protein